MFLVAAVMTVWSAATIWAEPPNLEDRSTRIARAVGDHYGRIVSVQDGMGRLCIFDGKKRFFYELSSCEIKEISRTRITDADRRNGVEYKGVYAIRAKSFRRRVDGVWTEWKAGMPPFPHLFSLGVVSRNGKIELQSHKGGLQILPWSETPS